MQKYIDVTLRIPLGDETDETTALTLAADVRQIVKDNGSDIGIDEVQIVAATIFEKE